MISSTYYPNKNESFAYSAGQSESASLSSHPSRKRIKRLSTVSSETRREANDFLQVRALAIFQIVQNNNLIFSCLNCTIYFFIKKIDEPLFEICNEEPKNHLNDGKKDFRDLLNLSSLNSSEEEWIKASDPLIEKCEKIIEIIYKQIKKWRAQDNLNITDQLLSLLDRILVIYRTFPLERPSHFLENFIEKCIQECFIDPSTKGAVKCLRVVMNCFPEVLDPAKAVKAFFCSWDQNAAEGTYQNEFIQNNFLYVMRFYKEGVKKDLCLKNRYYPLKCACLVNVFSFLNTFYSEKKQKEDFTGQVYEALYKRYEMPFSYRNFLDAIKKTDEVFLNAFRTVIIARNEVKMNEMQTSQESYSRQLLRLNLMEKMISFAQN